MNKSYSVWVVCLIILFNFLIITNSSNEFEKKIQIIPTVAYLRLPTDIRKYSESFLNLNIFTEDFVKKFGMTHLLLGGSVVYKHFEYQNKVDKFKDIDLILLVRNKHDMFKLILHKDILISMLRISKLESNSIDITENIKSHIDAIRFTGWQSNGTKIGIKILSLEYLHASARKKTSLRLNLLSFKDIHYIPPINFYSTRINKDLYILHEWDIFQSLSSDKKIFGPTMDLFMTAVPILEFTDSIQELKKMIMQKIPEVVFARYDSFHPIYCRWLASYLSIHKKIISHKEYANNEDFFLSDIQKPVFYSSQNPIKLILNPTKDEMIECTEKNYFSSNCRYGQYKEFFWKAPRDIKTVVHEVLISKKLKQFYQFIQEPVHSNKDTLFYIKFDGVPLSNLRYEYEKKFAETRVEDKLIRSKLMTAEMIVLSDILCAYKRSLRIGNAGEKALINRFFFERLSNSKRINELYPNGIRLSLKSGRNYLSIQELYSYNIIINKRNFGTLKEIENKAINILNPKNFLGIYEIFGLGDGHIGNILFSNKKNINQEYNILMVDYEASGYHPAFLDMVKPYYIDIFFQIFYADIISHHSLLERGIISKLEVNNNCIKIDININSCLSPHAFFLKKIRQEGLINPFKKFIALNQNLKCGQSIQNQMNIFGAGLFTNAVYTRDLSNRSDVFFANLALGILLFLGNDYKVTI